MKPIEITSLEALQDRIAAGGVLTVTRSTFAVPVAHMSDCPQLQHVRIPTAKQRYYWTPDYATALTGLRARRCRQCRWPRQARHP